MKFLEAKRRRHHAINMIPLINIVFLLLIFFILTSTFRTIDPIDQQLPEADSGESGVPIEVIVTVAADGELAIDGEPVRRAALPAAFGTLVAEQRTRLLIKVAQLASVAMLRDVMEAANAAGFEQVVLATRQALTDEP